MPPAATSNDSTVVRHRPLPFLFVDDIRVKLAAAAIVASLILARVFGVLRRL
jgi:hypothetical protein